MNWQTLCLSCMQDDSGEPVCPKCGGAFDLPSKNSLQLKPRTVLRDQYVIGRALGHGGFGVTYLAWDMSLEGRLAVKEFLPNGVAGRASGETKVLPYSEQVQQEFDWGLERFLDEARTLKKFSHTPGIVSIETIFRDNGTAYLVMEFLDGWTLEEFLKRRGGKVTFETALRILLPVIDALCTIHAEGVLHRDISPDNIHLTRDGKVKLIDFGAARNALGQKSRNLSIILKEGYAPEEQYRASGIQGPWTDVYATAATLYHCVAGRIPPPALDRLAEDRLQRPSELGIDIDHDAERALMTALSLRAADRFQSMEDFKAVLTGSASITAMMRAIQQNKPPAPPPAMAPAIANAPPLPPSPMPPVPHVEQMSQSLHLSPPSAPPPVSKSNALRWMVPAALGFVALIAIVIAMHPWRGPVPVDDSKRKTSEQVTKQDTQPDQPRSDPQTPAEPRRDASIDPKSDPGGPGIPGGPDIKEERKKAGPVFPQPRTQDGQPQSPALPDNRQQPQQQIPQQYQNPQQQNPQQNPNPQQYQNPVARPPADYESLINQAKAEWTARQFPQVQNDLNQAIRLDPAKPRAYSGLAELQLYVYDDNSSAAQNAQKAVAHGGEAVFHVRHDHSGETFTVQCTGKLYVSQMNVRFVPDTGAHAFVARKTDIREAKRNRMLGVHFGRQNSVDLHAFHIRLGNGQNFNFAPMSRSSEPERELILSLIGEK